MTTSFLRTSKAGTVAIAAAGLIAGGILASTLVAQAATPAPTPTPGTASSSGAATDPHPGDNGADGVPESQEVHGSGHGSGHGRGHGVQLDGTVTAVTSNTVTIKTSTATTTYTVTSTSDIDKNGEASLSDLVVGDAVRFSVDATKTTQIDKLHAGDEAKNMPQRPAGDGEPGTGKSAAPQPGSTASSSAAA